MIKAELTCSCYEPPFIETVSIKAEDLDEAWDKAKKKSARKHKAKVADICITACHWENI